MPIIPLLFPQDVLGVFQGSLKVPEGGPEVPLRFSQGALWILLNMCDRSLINVLRASCGHLKIPQGPMRFLKECFRLRSRAVQISQRSRRYLKDCLHVPQIMANHQQDSTTIPQSVSQEFTAVPRTDSLENSCECWIDFQRISAVWSYRCYSVLLMFPHVTLRIS